MNRKQLYAQTGREVIEGGKALAQRFGLGTFYRPGQTAPGWKGQMVYTGEIKGGRAQMMHADDWAQTPQAKKAAADQARKVAERESQVAAAAAKKEEAARKAATPESPNSLARSPLVNRTSNALTAAAAGGVAGVAAFKPVTSKSLGDSAAAAAPENRQTPPAAPAAEPSDNGFPDIVPKRVQTVPVRPDGTFETPRSNTQTPRDPDAPLENQPEPIKRPSVKVKPDGSINEQSTDRNRDWRRPQVTSRMFDPTPLEKQTVPNTPAAPEIPGGVPEPTRVQTTRVTPPAANTTPPGTPGQPVVRQPAANTAPAPAANTTPPGTPGQPVVRQPAANTAPAPAANTTPPPQPPAARTPARQPAAPKAEKPAEPKSVAMYNRASEMAARGENDTAAYWAAEAQRAKEEGRTAPNDFSDSSIGKFFGGLFGGKKVNEATKYLSMNPSSVNMFAEAKKLTKKQDQKLDVVDDDKIDEKDFAALRAGKKKMEEAVEKKADKDYDGDGKVESSKDEVWGSRLKAAKKAGKLEENQLVKKVVKDVVGAVKGMSAGEKAGIAAGGALGAAAGYGAGKSATSGEPKVIQQKPTERGAMDRIRDNLGLDSPDYTPKTDPNYKPDTGPSDEDKAALDKKVKEAIKESYLNILKRK